MGTNGLTYNVEIEYAKKTMKELEALRRQFEEAHTKYPDVIMFNEHLEYIKWKIAERIGKNGTL
jgi:hypothetical protein